MSRVSNTLTNKKMKKSLVLLIMSFIVINVSMAANLNFASSTESSICIDVVSDLEVFSSVNELGSDAACLEEVVMDASMEFENVTVETVKGEEAFKCMVDYGGNRYQCSWCNCRKFTKSIISSEKGMI